MVLKFEGIEWDCDEGDEAKESLPDEYYVEVESDMDDSEAVDMLSDEFGWLVNNCVVRRFEEVKK